MSIQPWEELCPVCKGTKLAKRPGLKFMIDGVEVDHPCYYCGGTGKTDWIQNITKKPVVPEGQAIILPAMYQNGNFQVSYIYAN